MVTVLVMACSDNTPNTPVSIDSLKQENDKFYSESDRLFTGNVYHNFQSTDTLWLEGTIDNGIPDTYRLPANLTSLNSRNNLYYPININVLYSGPFFALHVNGNIKEQGMIKDGVILGKPFISFYENGQTEKIDLSGSLIKYYENGQLKYEEILVEKNIQLNTYWEDGTIGGIVGKYLTGEIADEEFIKNNPYGMFSDDKQIYVFDGEQQFFYLSGQLWMYSNYNKGVLEGENISYYATGQIEKKDLYKNGFHHGESLEYYENGQLKRKRFYIEDKLDGESVSYFEDGHLESYRKYVKGVSIGTHYGLKNDQKTLSFKFVYDQEGRQEGEQFFSGDSKVITNYINGQKNGKSIFSNEDSTYSFVIKGYDKNDKNNGIETTYSASSTTYLTYRLDRITSYKNDEQNGLEVSISYWDNEIISVYVKNYLEGKQHGLQFSMYYGFGGGSSDIPHALTKGFSILHNEVEQYKNGKRDGIQITTNKPAYAKSQAEPIIKWSKFKNDKYEDGAMISKISDAYVVEDELWDEELSEKLDKLNDSYSKLLEDVDSDSHLNTHIYNIDLSIPEL